MVLLLNILVPLVVILLIWFAYKIKKVYPVLIAIAFIIIYQFAQPSYMPKGTVKPMPKVEFQQLDIPMVDRSLKTKSDVERDAERNKALQEIDNSINEQIKSNKE